MVGSIVDTTKVIITRARDRVACLTNNLQTHISVDNNIEFSMLTIFIPRAAYYYKKLGGCYYV